MTDLFVFTKPGDPSKSIIVLNCAPVFQVWTRRSRRLQSLCAGALYEIKIDTNGDAIAGHLLQRSVASSEDGKQTATVRRIQGARASGVGEMGEVIVEQAPVLSRAKKPW